MLKPNHIIISCSLAFHRHQKYTYAPMKQQLNVSTFFWMFLMTYVQFSVMWRLINFYSQITFINHSYNKWRLSGEYKREKPASASTRTVKTLTPHGYLSEGIAWSGFCVFRCFATWIMLCSLMSTVCGSIVSCSPVGAEENCSFLRKKITMLWF